MSQTTLAISHEVFPIRKNREFEDAVESLLHALGDIVLAFRVVPVMQSNGLLSDQQVKRSLPYPGRSFAHQNTAQNGSTLNIGRETEIANAGSRTQN